MRRSAFLFNSFVAGLVSLACTTEDKPAPTSATAADSTLDAVTVAGTAPGQPLPGLSGRELQLFNRGEAVFVTEFTPATGLGPLFNSTSCVACHNNPGLGGYGDSVEVHMSDYHPGAACNALGLAGGPVVQQHATPALQAALGILGEPTLPGATATGMRTTPVMFGLGLFDAVSDRTIRQLARIRYSDGVHGRAAVLPDGRVGRFGRKATTAALDDFTAGAFFNEMGITNPVNPVEGTVAGKPLPAGVDPAPDPELDPMSLRAADAFVKFLAPVAPLPLTPEATRGRELFRDVRCTSCHIPVLTTGYSPIPALRYKRFRAYTDLLLHDMGRELADMCNGVANPREFRTQPLIGMQFLDMFMHDGVSETIDEAVQRHGGEGSAARERFFALSSEDRTALVSFVMSQ